MDKKYAGGIEEYDRFLYLIANIKDVLWEIDADFMYTYLSPNAKAMSGYEIDEMLGRRMPDFLTEESRKYLAEVVSAQKPLRLSGNTDDAALRVVEFVCKDGSTKWVEVSVKPVFEENRLKGYIGTTRDITEKKNYECQLGAYIEELKVINEKLEMSASVDALTGAFNRRKFDDELHQNMREKKRSGNTFSLIFMDIDCFKMINDLHGHKKGDFVLRRITELLRNGIRSTDSLFRWGGDEFVVILADADIENAKKIAEKLRTAIENFSFGIGEPITVSLGVGEYNTEEDTDQVVTRLDKALFTAKAEGRNRVVAC